MLPIIESTANKFVLHVQNMFSTNANTKKTIQEENVTSERTDTFKENSMEVNSDELIGGYTADAIVPCAFGVRSHVMDNPRDPFAVALGAFYEMSFANIFEK